MARREAIVITIRYIAITENINSMMRLCEFIVVARSDRTRLYRSQMIRTSKRKLPWTVHINLLGLGFDSTASSALLPISYYPPTAFAILYCLLRTIRAWYLSGSV